MLLYIFVGGGGRRNFPIGTICYDYEGEEEASGSVSYSSFYTVIIVIIIAEKDDGLDCIRVVKRVMAACAPFFFSLLLGARFEIRPSGKRDREGKWNTIFNDAAKKRRKKEKWFRSNGGREEEKRSLSRSEANTSGGSIAMFLWKSSWSKPTDEFPCSAFPPRRKASFIQLEQVVERE